MSVITRRVLQTLAIALWRSDASHILQFHRTGSGSLALPGHVIVPGELWAVGLWRDSWLAQVVAFK